MDTADWHLASVPTSSMCADRYAETGVLSPTFPNSHIADVLAQIKLGSPIEGTFAEALR